MMKPSLRGDGERIRDFLRVWDALAVAHSRCRFGESYRLGEAQRIIEWELSRLVGNGYEDLNWIVKPWVNGQVIVKRR